MFIIASGLMHCGVFMQMHAYESRSTPFIEYCHIYLVEKRCWSTKESVTLLMGLHIDHHWLKPLPLKGLWPLTVLAFFF